MKNILKLEKVGFTKREAAIYLALFEEGASSVGKLAKKISVQRSTAYYLLDALEKKGFVTTLFSGNRKLFQANSPSLLEQKAKETQVQIQELATKLLAIQKKQEDSVSFHKGYRGLITAYNHILALCNSGDEILILGARGGEDFSKETYQSFYKNFNKQRIEKNVSERVIMNISIKKRGSYYEKLPKTRIRYLKQKTFVPLIIFSQGVAILEWKEEPSLFLLQSKSIADSFKQYFEENWKNAR